MNRRSFLSYSLALAACFSLATPVHAEKKPATSPIHWQKNLQAAHKAALKSGKPILIVFGAEWCFYCHKLEKETLGDAKTSRFINERFVTVKLDLDKDKKAAKILNVKSLPASIVVDTDANLLGKIVGYQQPKGYANNLRSALHVHQKLQQVSGETVVK